RSWHARTGMNDDGLAYLAEQAYQLVVTADEGSLDQVLRELHAVDPEATVAQEFAPGVLLVNCSKDFGEIAAAWGAQPPIFVRHVNPVQTVVSVDTGAAWSETLEAAAMGEIFPFLEPTLPFSVQSRVFAHADLKPF